MSMVLSLLLSSLSFAYVPSQNVLGSPALLADYASWGKQIAAFGEGGSETQLFRDLVEIVYDRDINRPWGADFYPTANRRFRAFRTKLCPAIRTLATCALRAELVTDADITRLGQSLQDPASLAALGARWKLEITRWNLPLREPGFSLVAGPATESLAHPASYWSMSPAPAQFTFVMRLMGDAPSYAEGFESRLAATILAFPAEGRVAVNDWLLRDRAMDFAADWKRAIEARRNGRVKHPIFDAKEMQFGHMFDGQAAEFTRVYAEQRALVSDKAEIVARFEKERGDGDFPEETYQRVAYDQLREIAVRMGDYFTLAAGQRRNTGAIQQSLEMMLTLQRYSTNPQAFVMELTTVMEPLMSHAFVIDETVNATIAQTYTLEHLKALIGLDDYAKQPLFPRLGQGLLTPELFDDYFLTEYAPEVKAALKGRPFSSLSGDEQRQVLGIYLRPVPGKIRMMGLYRLSVAWLNAAGTDELRELADRIHEMKKGSFK